MKAEYLFILIIALCLITAAGTIAAIATVVVLALITIIMSLRYWRLWELNMLADIKNKQADADFRHVSGSFGTVVCFNNTLTHFAKNTSKIPCPDTDHPLPSGSSPEPDAPTALDIGKNIDRGIICGSTRSGKTFFSKSLAAIRLASGEHVFAIDPKHINPADTWPDGVRIIGSGDNEAEVEDFLSWLESEKDRRGADIMNINTYPRIVIFWDELASMMVDRPDFQTPYLKILRKYAEYKIDLFVISQDDDKTSLALPVAAVKKNFRCALMFTWDMFTKERNSYVNYDLRMPTNPRNAQPLTMYKPVTNHCHKSPQSPPSNARYTGACADSNSGDICDGVTAIDYVPGTEKYAQYVEPETRAFYESRQDKKVVDLYESGKSVTAISENIYGYKNTTCNKKIKAVLKRYGYNC